MSFPLDIIPVMTRDRATREPIEAAKKALSSERPLPDIPETMPLAKKAWEKVIETLRPGERKKRKTKDLDMVVRWSASRLDASRGRGEEDRGSWDTMSSYAETVVQTAEGVNGINARVEGNGADLARCYEDRVVSTQNNKITKTDEGDEVDEVEDITALPPMPPPAITQPPAKKERWKQIKKKVSSLQLQR